MHPNVVMVLQAAGELRSFMSVRHLSRQSHTWVARNLVDALIPASVLISVWEMQLLLPKLIPHGIMLCSLCWLLLSVAAQTSDKTALLRRMSVSHLGCITPSACTPQHSTLIDIAIYMYVLSVIVHVLG